MGKCSQKRRTHEARANLKRPARQACLAPLHPSGLNRAERRAGLQREVSAQKPLERTEMQQTRPSSYPRASMHDLHGMLRAASKRLRRASKESPSFAALRQRHEERYMEIIVRVSLGASRST